VVVLSGLSMRYDAEGSIWRIMGRRDLSYVVEIEILLNHGVIFGFQPTFPFSALLGS